MLAKANKKNSGDVLEKKKKKKASEQTGRVEITKEEIPGSKRAMYGYYTDLLQALKGRTFKLCVLNRWELEFLRPQLPTVGSPERFTFTGNPNEDAS